MLWHTVHHIWGKRDRALFASGVDPRVWGISGHGHHQAGPLLSSSRCAWPWAHSCDTEVMTTCTPRKPNLTPRPQAEPPRPSGIRPTEKADALPRNRGPRGHPRPGVTDAGRPPGSRLLWTATAGGHETLRRTPHHDSFSRGSLIDASGSPIREAQTHPLIQRSRQLGRQRTMCPMRAPAAPHNVPRTPFSPI